MRNRLIEILTYEYELDKKEKDGLIKRAKVLEELKFYKLMENIIKNERKRLSFIAEMNVVYEIYKQLTLMGVDYILNYEEETKTGSPDLKLVINGMTIWIQIKRFEKLKTDNKNEKLMMKISEQLKKADKNLFYYLEHSEELSEDFVNDFIDFIMRQRDKILNETSFRIDNKSNQFIEIDFFKPYKLQVQHLTYGGSIGEGRLISEEAEEHIRNSIFKALKSISWDYDEKTINIIAAENDEGNDFEDIDFGNVIFGTEGEVLKNNRYYWQRSNDGLVHDPRVVKKLNYYVVLRKKDGLFSGYNKSLFIINDCKSDIVKRIFNSDKVIFADTFIE